MTPALVDCSWAGDLRVPARTPTTCIPHFICALKIRQELKIRLMTGLMVADSHDSDDK